MGLFLNIVAGLVFVISFWFGLKFIFEINEIAIGKASSQLLATIVAYCFFFRVDALPFVGDLLPFLEIGDIRISWAINFCFALLILWSASNIYINWADEWAKVKDDGKIAKVILLFTVSSLAAGFLFE